MKKSHKALPDKTAVLDHLKKSSPLRFRELAIALDVSKRGFRTLKRILKMLINSGDTVKTRSGQYIAAEKMKIITGTFEAHRDGYGFVLPDAIGEQDLFIPPRKNVGAMSGDRVVARIENPQKREARIIKILERARKKIVARLIQEGNFFYAEPKSKKIPFRVSISLKDRAGARKGDIVVVELKSYPTGTTFPEGRILKILSKIDEPKHEIDMIIEEYSLPLRFSHKVKEEVRELDTKIRAQGRTDCRHLLTVTIDGEKAKDFDDAVSIQKNRDGFNLWVHIADVSYYVPWDSEIDREARKRGTSFYAPDRVIPMLPKELSNILCSLVPKEDRLTFTIEMQFDKNGTLAQKKFYPSVINSNQRMTYTSVRKILVDSDSHERKKYDYLLQSFETMAELCELLRQHRIKRGSLDFDLPEPEVLLDIQGRPEAIIKAERNLSHIIIEEFMIAANEAVASYCEDSRLPAIYRIHEKPDPEKLEELKEIFRALGLKMKKTGTKAFHEVLQQAKGSTTEPFLNILLLRSLKQAQYSTDNIGHFGLASKTYTHFTSPIRRYPDLVVHRILKQTLGRKKFPEKQRTSLEKLLPDIALHSSRTERTAEEAEREVIRAMKAWFMKDKVGEEFGGFITDISPYGLKTQLKDFFIEGFLHVTYMPDDYYTLDLQHYRLMGKRTKKTFTIGDEINVRIERVDIEGREILFGLVS
jgi:ribonuclease R